MLTLLLLPTGALPALVLAVGVVPAVLPPCCPLLALGAPTPAWLDAALWEAKREEKGRNFRNWPASHMLWGSHPSSHKPTHS